MRQMKCFKFMQPFKLREDNPTRWNNGICEFGSFCNKDKWLLSRTKSKLWGACLTTVPVQSWSQSPPCTGWCPSNSQTRLSGRGGWELLFQLVSGECWFSVLPGGHVTSTADFHSALPCSAQTPQSDTNTTPSTKLKSLVTRTCFGSAHLWRGRNGKRCWLPEMCPPCIPYKKSQSFSPTLLLQVRDNFMLVWHLSGFLWLTTPKSAQLPSPFPIIFILYVKDLQYLKLQMGFKRKPQIRIKCLVKQLLSSSYMHSNYVSLHFQDLKSA